MPRRLGSIRLGDLLDAGLVKAGDEWFIQHRGGRRTVAHVTPRGTLQIAGDEYASPSTAARAVLGSSTNGWTRWKFQSGGRVEYADVLRRRLAT